jgi:hypothetical protein
MAPDDRSQRIARRIEHETKRVENERISHELEDGRSAADVEFAKWDEAVRNAAGRSCHPNH